MAAGRHLPLNPWEEFDEAARLIHWRILSSTRGARCRAGSGFKTVGSDDTVEECVDGNRPAAAVAAPP
jgi:hypothetical protein